MPFETLQGILLPFLGTVLGAACVFVMRSALPPAVQRSLTGFAAGVMVAASVWSLLIPAMEEAEHLGQLAFLPAVAGFWLGILFLLLLDRTIPHLHRDSASPEGPRTRLGRTAMLVLAVTLHNIPEGMAVSVPLLREELSRRKAFFYGQLSGIVEPIAAVIGAAAASVAAPVLPWALAFAAGAMVFVVVEEVVPEAQASGNGDAATMGVMSGFVLMMCLDVAFG